MNPSMPGARRCLALLLSSLLCLGPALAPRAFAQSGAGKSETLEDLKKKVEVVIYGFSNMSAYPDPFIEIPADVRQALQKPATNEVREWIAKERQPQEVLKYLQIQEAMTNRRTGEIRRLVKEYWALQYEAPPDSWTDETARRLVFLDAALAGEAPPYGRFERRGSKVFDRTENRTVDVANVYAFFYPSREVTDWQVQRVEEKVKRVEEALRSGKSHESASHLNDLLYDFVQEDLAGGHDPNSANYRKILTRVSQVTEQVEKAGMGNYEKDIRDKVRKVDMSLRRNLSLQVEVPEPSSEKKGKENTWFEKATTVFYRSLTGFRQTSEWARRELWKIKVAEEARSRVESGEVKYFYTTDWKDPVTRENHRGVTLVLNEEGDFEFAGSDGFFFKQNAEGTEVVAYNAQTGLVHRVQGGKIVYSWRQEGGVFKGVFRGRPFKTLKDQLPILHQKDETKLLFVDKKGVLGGWLVVNDKGWARVWALKDGSGRDAGYLQHSDAGEGLKTSLALNPDLLRWYMETGTLDLSWADRYLVDYDRKEISAFLRDFPHVPKNEMFKGAFQQGDRAPRPGIETGPTKEGAVLYVCRLVIDFTGRDPERATGPSPTVLMELCGVEVKKGLPTGEPKAGSRLVAKRDFGPHHVPEYRAYVMAQEGQRHIFLHKFTSLSDEHFLYYQFYDVDQQTKEIEERLSADRFGGEWKLRSETVRRYVDPSGAERAWKELKKGLEYLGKGAEYAFGPFQTAVYEIEHWGFKAAAAIANETGDDRKAAAWTALNVYTSRQETMAGWFGGGTETSQEMLSAYDEALAGMKNQAQREWFLKDLDEQIRIERQNDPTGVGRLNPNAKISREERARMAARRYGLKNIPGVAFQRGREEFEKGNTVSGGLFYATGGAVIFGETYATSAMFSLVTMPLKVALASVRTGLTVEKVWLAMDKVQKGETAFLAANEMRALQHLRWINRVEMGLMVTPPAAEGAAASLEFAEALRKGDKEKAWDAFNRTFSTGVGLSGMIAGLMRGWIGAGRKGVGTGKDSKASETKPKGEEVAKGEERKTQETKPREKAKEEKTKEPPKEEAPWQESIFETGNPKVIEALGKSPLAEIRALAEWMASKGSEPRIAVDPKTGNILEPKKGKGFNIPPGSDYATVEALLERLVRESGWTKKAADQGPGFRYRPPDGAWEFRLMGDPPRIRVRYGGEYRMPNGERFPGKAELEKAMGHELTLEEYESARQLMTHLNLKGGPGEGSASGPAKGGPSGEKGYPELKKAVESAMEKLGMEEVKDTLYRGMTEAQLELILEDGGDLRAFGLREPGSVGRIQRTAESKGVERMVEAQVNDGHGFDGLMSFATEVESAVGFAHGSARPEPKGLGGLRPGEYVVRVESGGPVRAFSTKGRNPRHGAEKEALIFGEVPADRIEIWNGKEWRPIKDFLRDRAAAEGSGAAGARPRSPEAMAEEMAKKADEAFESSRGALPTGEGYVAVWVDKDGRLVAVGEPPQAKGARLLILPAERLSEGGLLLHEPKDFQGLPAEVQHDVKKAIRAFNDERRIESNYRQLRAKYGLKEADLAEMKDLARMMREADLPKTLEVQDLFYLHMDKNLPEQGIKLRVGDPGTPAGRKAILAELIGIFKEDPALADQQFKVSLTMKGMTGSQTGKFVTIDTPDPVKARELALQLDARLKGKGFKVGLPPNEVPFGESGVISWRYGRFTGGFIEAPDGKGGLKEMEDVGREDPVSVLKFVKDLPGMDFWLKEARKSPLWTESGPKEPVRKGRGPHE